MKLTTQNIIALIFAVSSFVSLGFILAASVNYNDYYWQARSALLDPASNNTMVRSVLAAQDPNTGQIAIRARVTATNPTGYQGLTLNKFDITLFAFHTGNISQSVFAQAASNLQANAAPSVPLGPYSTVSGDLVINLNKTQSSQLQSFSQTYNGDIRIHAVAKFVITSFFDPVFGEMTPNKEQALPISWS